eukprot:TRINITY_DN9156_c0_g2_i1.p1 TRINITY_DN9156_c0_g2~~TRINITY_DN9156_c0_g2_i1.p1  ORF type:complete len:509 (+),score=113.89 TRINITY_DN9156_c0_g2_i1:78-1529(+)
MNSVAKVQIINPPPNRLPYPVGNGGYSTSQFETYAVNYGAGVVVLMIVPLVFAVLSFLLFLVLLLGMCCGCCNFHKKFVEKAKLPDKSVLLGATGLFGCLFIIALVVGAGVNYQLSASLDGAASVGNLVEAMGSDGVSLANTTLNNVQIVYNSVGAINSTVVNAIPSATQCTNYVACITNIFGLVDIVNSTLIGNLTSLKADTDTLLNTTLLDDLQAVLNGFPNLTKTADELDSLNGSLLNISSDISTLRTELTSLNASVSSARNFNFTKLTQDIDDMQSANLTLRNNNFTSSLGQVDSAISSMPNLTALAEYLDDPALTTQAYMLSNLSALNSSLYQFPNMSAIADSLDNIQGSLTQLDNVTFPSLKSQLATLKTEIQAINSTQIPSTLTQINSIFQSGVMPVVQNLTTFITSVNSSITSTKSLMKNISTFVDNINATIVKIKNVYLPNVRSALVTFNSTISNITCVLNILDSFAELSNRCV